MRRKFQFNPACAPLLIPAAASLLFASSVDYSRLELACFAIMLVAGCLAARVLDQNHFVSEWPQSIRKAVYNPWICCTVPAISSLLFRVLLLPWIPVPDPVVPDEQSHLFLAKTFLLGRLANPPHPLWQHFESIHILSQPTFSSMYFPGQAFFLVLGKLITGSFFGGVLLSTALFCAALTWFLRACVPAGWAFYGGMLAAVRFGAASYWNDSYWGGSVSALGGALVLGGCVTLRNRWTTKRALLLALGLALLASTRPYESIGLCVIMVTNLVWGLAHCKNTSGKLMRWGLAGAAVLLLFSGYFMVREFKAVTGNWFTLPYQLNQRMYGWPMTLPWFPVRAIAYRHPEFEKYYAFELSEHEMITNPKQIHLGVLLKLVFLWRFFFGVALGATVLFSGRILRNRRLRPVWLAAGVVLLQVFVEQSGYPHYASPIAAVFVLFWVQGLRYLAHFRPAGIRIGPVIVAGVMPLMFVIIGVRAAEKSSHSAPSASPNFLSWCCTDNRRFDRADLSRQIEQQSGKHLVLVHYEVSTYESFDWVYNDPNIDQSRIVFARDMGPERNEEIIRYFHDRRVWHVRVERDKTWIERIQPPKERPWGVKSSN